jgi:hypothetical protein
MNTSFSAFSCKTARTLNVGAKSSPLHDANAAEVRAQTDDRDGSGDDVNEHKSWDVIHKFFYIPDKESC